MIPTTLRLVACNFQTSHRNIANAFSSLEIQAKRFLEQVVNTKVGFTGMRFFYFTRPLILSVVGTIITYELVLIQFQVLTPKTQENLCKFAQINN